MTVWDTIAGRWHAYKGRARQRWGDLTDDDLDLVAGRREQLVGLVRDRYGLSQGAAEAQVAAWERAVTR